MSGHLHLVGSEPPSAPKKRRKGERRQLLSADETRRFKASMRALRDAFGTWPCLAAAMDISVDAINAMMRGSVSVSGDMIVRAMKASGLTMAEIFGIPVLAGTCRACGAVKRAS